MLEFLKTWFVYFLAALSVFSYFALLVGVYLLIAQDYGESLGMLVSALVLIATIGLVVVVLKKYHK